MRQKLLVVFLGLFCGLLLLEAFFQATGFFVKLRRDIQKRQGSVRTILCLGDSFTYGYGLDRKDSYPAQLEELLKLKYPGSDYSVINAGIVGANSRMVLKDLPDYLRKYSPAIIVLQAGGQNRFNLSGYDDKIAGFDYIRYNSRVIRLFRFLLANFSEKGFLAWRSDQSLISPENLLRPRDFSFNTGEISCAIDFTKQQGKIWEYLRAGDLAAAGRYLEGSTSEAEARGVFYIMSNLLDAAENYLNEQGTKNGSAFLVQLGLGFISAEKCELDSAISHFRQALRLKPNDTGALIGLGYAYFQAGMFDYARDWYETALALYPACAEGYNQLAQLYCDSFQFDKAVSVLEEGLKHAPDFADNLYSLGKLKLRKYNFSEAETLFSKALAAGLNEEDSNRIAYYREQMSILKNQDPAVSGMSQFYFPAEPDLSSTTELCDLAWKHVEQGNYEQALKFFDLAGDRRNAAWVRKILSSEISGSDAYRWLIEDLETINRFCSANGIHLILQNYPESGNKAMIQISAKELVPLVDNFRKFSLLWKAGGKREEYIRPDGHCSGRGCALMAENVLEVLEAKGWL
ncbi:MAG: tetratricopeptide repeat protein [Candidatus Wallbacteria bacterium]|nr:tetratricopeptide repeat protein [Candidatus Wallbacteria bacterium]